MEAMRSLKRRLSNVVYARMLADHKRREAAGPRGHSGTTLQSSVTGLTPDTGPSDKPLPGPATHRLAPPPRHVLTLRGAMSVRHLDSNRSQSQPVCPTTITLSTWR